MKILLIEMWLGKLPDYYKYHFKTMQRQNKNIDIYFFTDQEIDLKVESENYHILNTNLDDIQKRFQKSNGRDLILKGGNNKITDLKFSYFINMFSDVIDYEKYDYFGIHDIDTMFGDIYKWVEPYLGHKKFISIGGGIHHNRLSGPLLLFKNDQEILNLFKTEGYYKIFDSEEIYGYGEQDLDMYAKKINSVEIIQNSQNIEHLTSKILYETIYQDGSVYCDNTEILCSHFLHKKNVEFFEKDGKIKTYLKQKISDDFKWVTYCTENYQNLLINLLRSIKHYSSRKIIIYTINYDFNIHQYLEFDNVQFQFIRYNIEEGVKDERGRDFNIISSKPLICEKAIVDFPNDKFIYIDTDISFTINADSISVFLTKLKNYPLFNSHIHDIIYVLNLVENEEWSDTVDLIMKELDLNQSRIFPRRKTNAILFDNNSVWFFKEQMRIFRTLHSTNKLNLLRMHDEDLANILLSKFGLTDSLPLVDIEESYELSLEKFQNYTYSMTQISGHVKLPKNLNEIYFFHGFKKNEDYKSIDEIYGSTVLKRDDFLFIYEKNTLSFIRNHFLNDKKIQNSVSFLLLDKFDNEIFKLTNQNLYNYFWFYISDIFLDSNIYKLKIIEDESERIIYNNIFEIK